MKPSLGFIGCGQMAQALLGGFSRHSDMLGKILLYDMEAEKSLALSERYGGEVSSSGPELTREADLILLAVKPTQVPSVLEKITPAIHESKLIISVAAGVSISDIHRVTGEHVPVVRVMPNVPCLIGHGVMGVSFSSGVPEYRRRLILDLFSTVGQVELIPEQHMDGVTAVSGSGPAFIFLVAEAMTDAAVDIGLPRDLARRLVEQTLVGSSLMLQQGDEHPAVLRERVTSPGGTTIAGLRALESGGLRSAFFNAIMAAYQRSAKRN